MIALLLCGVAFAGVFLAGRRSLVAGLGAVLLVGYLYGIVRANVTSAFSHFIFDAALVGLYATQLLRPIQVADRIRTHQLRVWLLVLLGWPLLLLVIPIQDPLVQLVGLRAHIFFLPFLLFGARLGSEDMYRLALMVAGLNLMSFSFAMAEFLFGLQHFYPRNEVTELVYRSNDIRVAGTLRGAYRIPATFANAAPYGATMVITLPLLLGGWLQRREHRHRILFAAALGASVLGVFFSATRMNLLILGMLLLVSLLSGGMGTAGRVAWAFVLAGVGWAVASQERLFLRLLSLTPDAVIERITWSMNWGVIEHVMRYPLGNGLGGGGTSMPYFLLHLVRDPMPVENQYATIMLEQGLPGLMLWFGFIVWAMTRRTPLGDRGWRLARRLGWVACVALFLTGFIGQGLFTAIPPTPLLFIWTGWLAVAERRRAEPRGGVAIPPSLAGAHA